MQRLYSGLLAVALSVATLGCDRGPKLDEIRSAIRSAVESDTSKGLRTFYTERDYEPAFVYPDEDRLQEALELLCRSEADGLNVGDYLTGILRQQIEHVYGEKAESGDDRARRLGELDIAVSQTMMRYASHILTGRVDPKDVSSTWKMPVHEVEPWRIVNEALSSESLESIPGRIDDIHDQYGKLRQALARYRSIKRNGGWTPIPNGEVLEEGDSGERVKALIERLVVEGDLDSTILVDSTYRYTPHVAEAVQSVQNRFGLEVDGVAGERVLSVLNVPVDERIEQIEINMERWRWIPGHFGSRYLYVNIPAFELHAFDEGREVLSMPVIVGKVYEDSATPVFTDTLEYVEFNPYWNVPESIASDEIVPNARADESYLVRNGYEILSNWTNDARILEPTNSNLDRVEAGTYRVRQKPGSLNALGRVKFMFPNEFNIYLHDTPQGYLFERAARAYSHGCIRVANPRELGEFVFSGEWTSEQVENEIESRERRTVSIPEPLPVYILYWTAFVDEDGRINFREDLYGNDAGLQDALRAHSTERGVPCETLRSLIKS